MSDNANLERRVAELEREVAALKARAAPADNWLAKVRGVMTDEEAFEEATRYGREFRWADRPADDSDGRP